MRLRAGGQGHPKSLDPNHSTSLPCRPQWRGRRIRQALQALVVVIWTEPVDDDPPWRERSTMVIERDDQLHLTEGRHSHERRTDGKGRYYLIRRG